MFSVKTTRFGAYISATHLPGDQGRHSA